MYADDTMLYCCLEDIDHVNKQAVVNQELQKNNNWLIANGLKLNTNKSKYMIFSKPNKNIPVLQFLLIMPILMKFKILTFLVCR